MGLFNHEGLEKIFERVERKDYSQALTILQKHFTAEKELSEDLGGLQVAINVYNERLKEINALLKSKGQILGAGKEAGTTQGTFYLQAKLTEDNYLKALRNKLTEAVNSTKRIEAILAKLWRKDRKAIE